jgi:L-fucose isomerase
MNTENPRLVLFPSFDLRALRFARAGLAVAAMRGKSYLSMGAVSMGIAGSMVNPDFFQDSLGMRGEYVDMSEFIRRMEEGILDPDEFKRALAWTRKLRRSASMRRKTSRRSLAGAWPPSSISEG